MSHFVSANQSIPNAVMISNSVVSLIDRVLSDIDNETEIAAVRKEVNDLMANYPLFAW